MGTVTPKEFLGSEQARNHANAQLYVDIMQAAYGKNYACFIGHHLSFEQGSDLSTENEIPAADTLIFDHTIMGAVFGEDAIGVMRDLAATPVEGGKRDALLSRFFYNPVRKAA